MVVKVVTNPERMIANWRVAMFSLANLFLATNRAFQSTGIVRNPTELQIYLTVAVANIQKLVRERQIPEEFAGTAILPREWVIPISRNAIAAATGLPRETVRRHVESIIARGLLVEDERGGVTLPEGLVPKLELEPIIEPIMTEFTRTAEHLIRLGVVERAYHD